MKKLLMVLGFLTCFYSCSTIPSSTKSVTYYSWDFKKYNANNFLFDFADYSGNFESIAYLSVQAFPEVRSFSSTGSKQEPQIIPIKTQEIIDSLYIKACSLGADAIVRFNVGSAIKYNNQYPIQGIEVSGFAIKRKPIDVKLVK